MQLKMNRFRTHGYDNTTRAFKFPGYATLRHCPTLAGDSRRFSDQRHKDDRFLDASCVRQHKLAQLAKTDRLFRRQPFTTVVENTLRVYTA